MDVWVDQVRIAVVGIICSQRLILYIGVGIVRVLEQFVVARCG